MKSFKQYNENLKDLIKGKSDDEVIKGLDTLNFYDRIVKIRELDLDDNLLPSDERIEEYLIDRSDDFKIEFIIKYQLNFDLLPRNKKGICVYDGNLYCSYMKLTKLPDNLSIMWSLYCQNNNLTELPENLTLGRDLICDHNQLTKIPNNIKVKNTIYCKYNKLTSLPDNLELEYSLDCSNNLLEKLPKNMKIGVDLLCYDNIKILKLPRSAKIGGNFVNIKPLNENIRQYLLPKSEEDILKYLNKLSNEEKIEFIIRNKMNFDLLPRNEDGICIHNGTLNLYKCYIEELPDNLTVKGNMNCSRNQLDILPKNLTVYGNLNCSYNNIAILPESLKVYGDLISYYNRYTLITPPSSSPFVLKGRFINRRSF